MFTVPPSGSVDVVVVGLFGGGDRSSGSAGVAAAVCIQLGWGHVFPLFALSFIPAIFHYGILFG